jgi:hypothetical protein
MPASGVPPMSPSWPVSGVLPGGGRGGGGGGGDCGIGFSQNWPVPPAAMLAWTAR